MLRSASSLRAVLLLLLSLFSPFAVAAGGQLAGAVQMVGGMYGSIGLHEGAHALAFLTFGGEDIRIRIPREGTLMSGVTHARLSRPMTAGESQIVAVSGLLAQSLAGELVLQRHGLQDSRAMQGVLGMALASNIVHVATYYTRVRGVDGYAGNDIDAYELAGGNPHVLSALLVAYTASALKRMHRQQIPLFAVNLRF